MKSFRLVVVGVSIILPRRYPPLDFRRILEMIVLIGLCIMPIEPYR